MIVNPPNCLHECVADGGSDKPESPLLEIFAQRVRFSGRRGYFLDGFPVMNKLFSVDELPHIPVECSKFLSHLHECSRIAHGRFNLKTISHNSDVVHQTPDIPRSEPGNSGKVPPSKCPLVGFPFSEDGNPAHPRLYSFKCEHAKKLAVIVERNAPLFVMVSLVKGIASGPGTSGELFHGF